MSVRRHGDGSWANPPGTGGNLPRSLPAGYQNRLNPAVMLLRLAVVPASSTEVVSLIAPTSVCSTLSLLRHCASTFDDVAPAEKVVPEELTFRQTDSSAAQAGAVIAVAVAGFVLAADEVVGGADAPLVSDCKTE